MYLSDVSFQNQVLLLSVGFGMLLGFVYDAFRLIRLALGDKRYAVFLQDLLYCVLAAFLTVLFLLTVNHGSLRLFILLAMTAGFFSYYCTLSRVVVRVGRFFFQQLHRLVSLLARLISAPLRFLLHLFGTVKKKIAEIMKKSKNRLEKNTSDMI